MTNPEAGFFATANNRIVGDDYPYPICLDFAPPFRAQRLTDRLARDDGRDIGDDGDHPRREVVHPEPRLRRAARSASNHSTSASAAAKAQLQAWDGVMGPESVPAAHLRRLARADHQSS